MSFKSFKSEFIEVYNYLIAACKDPVSFFDPYSDVSYASEDDFLWKDDNPSTGVIINYIGNDAIVKVPNGVVEIGSCTEYGSSEYDPDGSFGCFQGCVLTDVILPKSLKIIGRYAFCSCDKLTSIIIPDSVTSIDMMAFAFCNNLTSIVLPNRVESIGEYAFEVCKNLESITIPNGVKSIGICAFSYCESLESIDIPNSVTSIGESAFYNCNSLTSITCSATLDLSNTSVPDGCSVIRR